MPPRQTGLKCVMGDCAVLRSGHNPNFGGWDVEGSWVITGESHKYIMPTASYLRPRPDELVGNGGFGAWEVTGRYSSTDLNYHTGGSDAVYGGSSTFSAPA